MTHYFIIIAYFIIFFTLLCHIPQVSRISRFLCLPCRPWFELSLLRVSIPHKPAVGSGGGCSLSSRTADEPKQKYFRLWNSSRRWSRTTVWAVPGAGWGRVSVGSVIIWLVIAWCTAQLIHGHLSQCLCVNPRTGWHESCLILQYCQCAEHIGLPPVYRHHAVGGVVLIDFVLISHDKTEIFLASRQCVKLVLKLLNQFLNLQRFFFVHSSFF